VRGRGGGSGKVEKVGKGNGGLDLDICPYRGRRSS